MSKVKARVFRGTRDLLPPDMILREKLFSKIRTVFSNYGFDPLETPAIEHLDVLTGKYGDGENQIYKLNYKTGTENEVALRYDLTVPLSRVVAMNRDIPMPFRRYQIQNVWRADTPQIKLGRLREFTQCDIDIVGTNSIIADVEVISAIDKILKEIGLVDKFLIRINNRRFLDQLLRLIQIDENLFSSICISIDKLDKITTEQFKTELIAKEIEESKIDALISLLSGDIDTLKSEELKAEYEEFTSYLNMFGVTDFKLDFTLARGMSYYNGTIFEIIIPSLSLGSIAGGGRYDKLSEVFGLANIPSVGGSIGLDRVISALEQLDKVEKEITKVKFLILNFGEATMKPALEMLAYLRENNLPTEFYYKKDKITKQFTYADRKNIPYVIIIGENEVKSNLFSIKTMKTGMTTKINNSIKEFLITLYNEQNI